MTNQEYKNAALAALKGNWAPAVLASIVYILIAIAVSGCPIFIFGPASSLSSLSSLGVLLFMVPLEVGFYAAFVKLLTEGNTDITHEMFSLGFSGWLHKVLTMILMGILVMLGMFLFILPGIYLAFCYSMVPYLLYKHPELSATETLKASRIMMKGHKFDYFWLCLSFIGWIFLCFLTVGIGYFWLLPYMSTSIDAFWEDVYSQSKLAMGIDA